MIKGLWEDLWYIHVYKHTPTPIFSNTHTHTRTGTNIGSDLKTPHLR